MKQLKAALELMIYVSIRTGITDFRTNPYHWGNIFLHRSKFCFLSKFGSGSGVQYFLYQNCHHEILYPPPYKRKEFIFGLTGRSIHGDEITCFASNFYLRVIKFWQESLKVFEVHAILLYLMDGHSSLSLNRETDFGIIRKVGKIEIGLW